MPLQELLTRASSLLAREVQLDPSRRTGVVPVQGSAEFLQQHVAGLDLTTLQRHTLEFLRALLAESAPSGAAEERESLGQVPLIACAAGVQAGATAVATIRVANDESSPVDVSLYWTNFVADNGYVVPSLVGQATPRVASIPAGGEVAFQLEIRVPLQTPPGTYSGLVQAAHTKYVKAVVSFYVT